MRVLGNLSDYAVLQTERTPDIGDTTAFNGKFPIPIPEGAKIDVNSGSYITPIDGGDLSSLAFAGLLARYPMYEFVVFNPLLVAADVAELDLTATFPNGAVNEITRAQTGRGTGPAATGTAPCSTAILPQNNAPTPARPGLLITDTIDISSQTAGVGADDFMVWWKIYEFSTSHDVASDYGATAGMNKPAIRSIEEIDQEPANFEVHLSIDDGINYTQVGRLEPVAFCVKGTELRLAFRNTGSVKHYLCSYCIMF